MTKEEAKELILHMWVHEGYEDNGYLQMSTEQKKLYCKIIGAKFDPLRPLFGDEKGQLTS